LGNIEHRKVNDKTVERQLEKKSSMKSQNSSSFYDRMKNGLGVASAGAWKAAEATLKVTTAVFAVQSGFGIGRVEGFSAPGNGTELQALCDYNLSKVPEHFVQQEQTTPIETQAKTLRAVAEKAKEDPQFERKLLETWKGKQQEKETERLTPEKLDGEIWESVGRILQERRELNSNTGTAVVLVHGIADISGTKVDCKGGYWGDTIKYLKAHGYSDIHTVKYYNDATNCDIDLHASAYENPCWGWQPGFEGTTNENLEHIGCKLAQYLYQNFGKTNKNVILVGHSMGGIVVRSTMSLVEKYAGNGVFPTSIGHVTDAVTFNTPHGGVIPGESVICGDCDQVRELTSGSAFLSNLKQNPQTSSGFTQWTVVGSECDVVVTADSAVNMQASHAAVYPRDAAPCYDHGGALHDNSEKNDALLFYCDTSDPAKKPCGTDYRGGSLWQITETGKYGLSLLNKAMEQ
jgi:hypothetical protein